MPSAVSVRAPSRLHLGLLSFGHTEGRQFGGAGIMIDRPTLHLEISPAEQFEAAGPLRERVELFAQRWLDSARLSGDGVEELQCRVAIRSAPRPHTGLGSGTQLAMSIAAGLDAFFGHGRKSPIELALSVGRGERSAIGTYGFTQGGLLVEAGRLPHEAFSTLISRIELPEQWRFILVCPTDEEGLHGVQERTAFERLPAVPRSTTEQLCEELLLHMLPAATTGDFARFSQSVYRYGYTAGMCFASRQYGAFANKRTAAIVAALLKLGVEGVAQSSWGPTAFGIVESPEAAEEIGAQVQSTLRDNPIEIQIAAANNRGALVELRD